MKKENIEKENVNDKSIILKKISQEDYDFMTEFIDNTVDLLTAHKQILSAIKLGVAIPKGLIRNYNKQDKEAKSDS